MKKLFLLLIGTALITVGIQAQFKMTAKTHGFRIGDSHNFVFAKGIDEGQSGREVFWNFTGLQNANKSLTSHMITTEGQDASNTIENSNLVLEEFGNKFFFSANNEGMLQYGAVSCNTVTKYDKPFVKLKFPFSYGNKVAGNYSGVQTSGTSNINITGTYEVFADAYGTLLLPNDITFENVLRVKQTRTIQYPNSSNVVNEITYRWYDKDVRYPVLVIIKYVTEKSSNIAEIAYYGDAVNKKKAAQMEATVNQEGLSALNIFPNPFEDVLKISYNLEKASKVNIDLYDISGKLYTNLVQTKQDAGFQELEFPAAGIGMMSGVYYVRITSGDQTFTRKIVKL